MSKMDALRAMREAKYAANQTRGATAPAAAAPRAKPAAAKAPVAPVAPPVGAGQEPEAVVDELCGHRNMSGRTCTREKAHSAKSHRYS